MLCSIHNCLVLSQIFHGMMSKDSLFWGIGISKPRYYVYLYIYIYIWMCMYLHMYLYDITHACLVQSSGHQLDKDSIKLYPGAAVAACHDMSSVRWPGSEAERIWEMCGLRSSEYQHSWVYRCPMNIFDIDIIWWVLVCQWQLDITRIGSNLPITSLDFGRLWQRLAS